MKTGERIGDTTETLQQVVDSALARVWVKLPVKVTKVDLTKQTVSLQPQVMNRVQKPNGQGQLEWVDQSMPELQDVPIKYPTGGGMVMTFPVAVGDEGTVGFASRCIDNWWADGGEQPQVTKNGSGFLRMNNLSDGFFEMGGRSQPSKLTSVSSTATELRSTDGTKRVSFDGSTFEVHIGSSFMTLDASGNLRVSGEITAHAGGTNNTVGHHTHAQDPDSDGDAEVETHAPTANT